MEFCITSKPGLTHRVFSCLLGIVCAGSVLTALADEQPAFSLQGFGTLGAVRTSSDEVQFVRDLSQPYGAGRSWDARVDSVLGVQASWRISPQMDAVVQAVSRYHYDKTFMPEVSWAFLKYEPSPNLSLRAGRLGTEFFILSDSRLVGYSNLAVRPPGDFFWSLPFYSVNGADVALTLPQGDHLLRGKLFYGISDEKIPFVDKQWDLDGSTMVGGYVDYLAGGWQFRASYANLLFKNDIPLEGFLQAFSSIAQQTAAYLTMKNTRTHYYSLGAVYDNGPWQLQLMLNHIRQESQAFESSDSGYVLAGYRIGSVTPYIGYSWVFSKSRESSLNPLAARLTAKTHLDQKTTILGARWDVARNVALKAQWDAIHGAPTSILPYRWEQPGWGGNMDVFSLTMDFVF